MRAAGSLRCIKAMAHARAIIRQPCLIDKPQLIATDDVPRTLQPSGAWTIANVEPLEQLCDMVPHAHARAINLSRVTTLDTVGAWLLEKLARWSCELSAKPR